MKTLLIVPIVLLSLSLLYSFYFLMGPGTFLADVYYIPLGKFVAEPQRREMEELVINIYNSQVRGSATIAAVRDSICLLCLLAVYLKLDRRTKQLA
jgi:hypothetical protein